jgi:hypothetical protein
MFWPMIVQFPEEEVSLIRTARVSAVVATTVASTTMIHNKHHDDAMFAITKEARNEARVLKRSSLLNKCSRTGNF